VVVTASDSGRERIDPESDFDCDCDCDTDTDADTDADTDTDANRVQFHPGIEDIGRKRWYAIPGHDFLSR
jgi:hypothetical protein